jgi:asparagine synthase (glutamine-hydrolysing)
MSGVFGIVDTRPGADAAQVLTGMAEKMSHYEWHQCDRWNDSAANVALGRLGIGILNQRPQPAINRDGQTVLFMAGEFFDWDGASADPRNKRDTSTADADYALQLYEAHGPNFARCLSGSFIITIYDRSRQMVVLTTSRFGLYPTYLYCQNGLLIFAPEVKGVLHCSKVPRRLDETALAQYMRFQQVLGTRTFLQDVQLLPHASTLTFDLRTGACQIAPYWSFAEAPPEQTHITFAEAVEETTRLMRLAVKRRLRGNHRFGIYLSGGLDSRMILAAYPREQPRPTTLTFGIKDCRDVFYARQIATRAGTKHHFYEFRDGKWVKDYADLHLKLTEGFHTWVHLHGINTLPLARREFDINLTGFVGDSNIGGTNLDSILGQSPDDLAFLTRMFWLLNQSHNWPGLTESEERLLYTPAAYSRLAGLAFESLRQEMQAYLNYDYPRRGDFFILAQSDLQHYTHYLTFTRSHLDVRYPYLDYDLTDFLWSLPISFRENRRLLKASLSRLSFSLATVPNERDEFLPIDNDLIRNSHALIQRAKRRFNRHIYPLFHERFTLHSDYETWLRTDLREWAESILNAPRLFESGIFNPDFIRSVWARHLSGYEQWTVGKIAPIMTYSMLLKVLFDEDLPA